MTRPRLTGRVSVHFTWEELVRPADQHHLFPADILALRVLAQMLLDPIRQAFGKPLVVTSAFRTPAHNASVGGSPHSQHLYGEAADVVMDGTPPRAIADYLRLEGPAVFKVGIYDRHLHVAIPSRDLVNHPKPAAWDATTESS